MGDAMPMTERRATSRVAADLAVKLRLSNGGMPATGTLRNVSLGGAFVETEDTVTPGSELSLEFSLPPGPRAVRCKVFVVWSSRTGAGSALPTQGVGVRLTDVGISELRALSQFVDDQGRL